MKRLKKMCSCFMMHKIIQSIRVNLFQGQNFVPGTEFSIKMYMSNKGNCPFKHVPALCPYFMSPLYVPTSCPHFMFPLYAPTLCPHFIPPLYAPTLCPHFMPPLYAPTLCPCFMFPLYAPTLCPHFMFPLYAPTLCPHFMSLLYVPVTCSQSCPSLYLLMNSVSTVTLNNRKAMSLSMFLNYVTNLSVLYSGLHCKKNVNSIVAS